MKSEKFLLVLIVSLIQCGAGLTAQDKQGTSLKYSAGFEVGYNRGFGLQGNITAYNFDSGFPFRFRFGIGYTFLNPGNAEEARRIFVNNATNGTPEKKGHSFDYRLDFMVPKTVFGVENSFLSFGPRLSTYLGDFKYVGGNEDFEVRSLQWGVGAGLENHFRMMGKAELVISYGMDFYFPSSLSGHDSTYSPDNDNVNPKNDNRNDNAEFRYSDADKAIYQPKFMPHIMIGLNFSL